jgi:hypothetical protein
MTGVLLEETDVREPRELVGVAVVHVPEGASALGEGDGDQVVDETNGVVPVKSFRRRKHSQEQLVCRRLQPQVGDGASGRTDADEGQENDAELHEADRTGRPYEANETPHDASEERRIGADEGAEPRSQSESGPFIEQLRSAVPELVVDGRIDVVPRHDQRRHHLEQLVLGYADPHVLPIQLFELRHGAH